MREISDILLIMQAVSMGVSLTLFLVLVLSCFQKPDTTRTYENVRWLLTLAMLLLGIHYFLQMWFGFRAQGDEVGAVFNILFYSPVTYILSYSILRIGCGRGYHRKFLLASVTSMTLTLCSFIYGYLHYGSLHMQGVLYIMGLIYLLTVVFFIIYPMKEVRRVRKLVDEESGQEPIHYNQYMRTSVRLLYIASILVAVSIFCTSTLVIAGPLFLIALVFYIISFVALGFNIRQVNDIFVEETEEEVCSERGNATVEAAKTVMDDEQKAKISDLIEEWRKNQGYATAEINSSLLASRLNIPKRQLVQYLREVEGKTFRIWLSGLRLEEAKRKIIEHPEYSNETIAERCGFSRSHLQVKFKETTGLTINEWRANNAKK